MRRLNDKQKEILKRFPQCSHYDELPVHIYKELVKLNDYETLDWDINRFLWDQFMAAQLARKPW